MERVIGVKVQRLPELERTTSDGREIVYDVVLRIATLRGERMERCVTSLPDLEARLARKGVDVSLLSEYITQGATRKWDLVGRKG